MKQLQIESLNKTITRTYEDGAGGTVAGRPNGYSFADGSATWGYDSAGRLSSVTDGTDTFTYGYQANSYGLVGSVAGPVHAVANTWDTTRDALLSRENSVGSNPATTLSKFTYTMNGLGQRTALTPSGSAFATTTSIAWGYNPRGEVVAADRGEGSPFNRTYSYDLIGNRVTATDQTPATTSYFGDTDGTQAGANPLNQYAKIVYPGTAHVLLPVHDLDGNLTSGPVPGASGLSAGVPLPSSATLAWDGENRLVQAVVNSVTVDYQYDYLGRLVCRTQGSAVTHYLYDGWNRVAEYTAATDTSSPPVTTYTLVKTLLWGLDLSGTPQGAGGVGGLLSLVDAGGSTRHYPTFDGNGNVSEYVNQAGTKVAHFEYDPFGNLTVDSESNAADFPYRFSTKPQDPVTGLYYYGYRYYDPLAGRWPSRDPIEEGGGPNLYEFVGNDGVADMDVLGLIVLAHPLSWDLELPADAHGKRPLKRLVTHASFSVSSVNKNQCTVDVVVNVHFMTGRANRTIAPFRVDQGSKKTLSDILVKINGEVAKKWNRDDYRMCCDGCPKCNEGIQMSVKVVQTAGGFPIYLYSQNARVDNESNWNIDEHWLYAIPHEVGHLLGRPDEYNGPIRDPRNGDNGSFEEDKSPNNIMFDEHGIPQMRHFSEIPKNTGEANCKIIKKGERCK